MAVGDFNSDGHADLCVGASNVSAPTIFLGDGTGTFTELFIPETGGTANPERFLAGDVDNDGKTDLVTSFAK